MSARSTTQDTCDVAVIGAGPHGLSTAAHLRDAGIGIRVFGDVMGFWRQNMPAGMVLRSERPGSHIPDPGCNLTLEHFEAKVGRIFPPRMALKDFIAYGTWFQQEAVPDIDTRKVRQVESQGGLFRLTLEDGGVAEAKRVVIATGLESFASRPPVFDRIPREFAMHSSEIRDPSDYAGRRVIVIGAGQSALEMAALLHEAGADIEVLARQSELRFLSGKNRLRNTALHLLVYPPGEVGPPGVNWIIQLPDLFRSLPMGMQHWVTHQVTPVGSAWLRPRLTAVRKTAGRSVTDASVMSGQLQLALDDGTKREVDHVVLATGYRVDLSHHPILAPALISSLQHLDGSPRLRRGLESSVPGLHFVGAAAAASFGPLMRFVAGAGYSARAVTREIASSLRRV